MSRPPHARLAPSARLAVVLALLAVGASMAGADEPGGPARAQIRRRAYVPLALRLADGFAAPVEAPPTATARPTERPEATRTPEPTRRPEPTRAPEPTEPGGATPTATTTPAAASGIGQRLYKSGAIGVTADGRTVWSVNTFADRVARIDTAGGAVRDIDLPGDPDGPRGIAVADDGQSVWVACHDSDRVYVLDAAGAVARTIQLPFGSGPYGRTGAARRRPAGGRRRDAAPRRLGRSDRHGDVRRAHRRSGREDAVRDRVHGGRSPCLDHAPAWSTTSIRRCRASTSPAGRRGSGRG
ncbi:MAG: SMP-30/gluconolactonase/LRE family protein [Anaerolineae bacterium]